MPTDLTVIMEDRPGKLAELGEATGKAGVNIEGLCAMVGDGKGFIHILVQDEAAAKGALEEAGIDVADERDAVIVDLHDKPGAMGEIARDLADAGVECRRRLHDLQRRPAGDRHRGHREGPGGSRSERRDAASR